jgi:uncharacterized membrane protein YozB (DUF420 family)
MSVYDLPAVNAALNSTSAALLFAGWRFIRARRIRAHIICMAGALLTSTVFLSCYLYYHAHAGSVRFPPLGAIRTFYLGLLLTHTIAAVVCLPMVILTVIPALRRRFDRHRAVARWTLPLWLYVSVTGVLIYFMLYHWFPPDEVLRRRAARTSGLQSAR